MIDREGYCPKLTLHSIFRIILIFVIEDVKLPVKCCVILSMIADRWWSYLHFDDAVATPEM